MTDAARSAATRYRIDDLVLDTGSRRVMRDGHEIELPKLSFDLFSALAAAAPAHAIDAALKFRPDIILMDIVMPEKDGLSLACEMLNDDSLRHIPIIMVTALADELESRAVTRDGILYLSKPVAMKELLEKQGGLPGVPRPHRVKKVPEFVFLGQSGFHGGHLLRQHRPQPRLGLEMGGQQLHRLTQGLHRADLHQPIHVS